MRTPSPRRVGTAHRRPPRMKSMPNYRRFYVTRTGAFLSSWRPIMAKNRKKLAMLAEKWKEAAGGGGSLEQRIKLLTDHPTNLGLQSNFGWVILAGPNSDGTFHVEFATTGGGWVSNWPKWAYEPALLSLLHRKNLWVISNGDPFGDNLLQVIVFQG